MTSRKPQLFDPARPPEPKYFTRVPDDALEDPRLTMSNIGVFAEFKKGHWNEDKPHKVAQTELAKRCRMSVRKLRSHLTKLELYGYIARLRIPGQGTQINLIYQLRPALELAPDESGLPITRGTRKCDGVGPKGPTPRTKRSDPSDQKVRPLGPKGPTPLLIEREEREISPEGGKAVASAPTANPPPWDPHQQEVINLATQRWGACNGDYFVGDLLGAYPPELVRVAMDRHWDKVGPGLRPALLRSTCQGMLVDGWKPDQSAQRRAAGTVPYKPEGPVPPSVKPMTDKERADMIAAGERLMAKERERARNGRRQQKED
jgi:hypothetical protein